MLYSRPLAAAAAILRLPIFPTIRSCGHSVVKKMKRILSLLILLALTTLATAKTVYLDPLGSDKSGCGTGTGTSACYSINYIQINNIVAAGDTVKIEDGTYLLTAPIQLTKSGGASTAITYTADGSARPVFTGATQIKPWTLDATCDNVNLGTLKCYSASVAGKAPFDYILYLPSGMALADAATSNVRRYESVNTPTSYNRNAGLPTCSNPCLDRVYVATSQLPAASITHNLADVKFYNFSFWNVDLLRLLSVTNLGANTQLQFSGQANSSSGISASSRYLIVNALEYFQSSPKAGTFYVDCPGGCSGTTTMPNGSKIYYIANTGEHPDTTDTVMVPQVQPLLTATGQKYINITGVYFVADNFTTPSGSYPNGGYTSNTGQPNAPAALSFVNTSNIAITSSVIGHTSGWGLEFTNTSYSQQCPSGTNQNNALQKSVLYDIGTSGIRLGRYPPDSQDTGNFDSCATSHTTVNDNFFQGTGRMYPGGEAGCIWIGSSHNNTITNNDCNDSYGGGIAVGPAVNAQVAYVHDNVVSHNLFRNLGEGVIVDFGCVHFANRGGASLQGPNGDTFDHNICHDITHSWTDSGNGAAGLYIDNFSQHVHANYNLIYRSSGDLYFHNQSTDSMGNNLCGGTDCDNTVFNNVFAYPGYVSGASSGQGAIKRGGDDLFRDFTFKHNIVFSDIASETGPQWMDSAGLHGWDCATGVDCTLYFNFLSNGYYNSKLPSTVSFYTTGTNMTWSGLANWQTSGHPNEDLQETGVTGHAAYGPPGFNSPGLPNCGGADDYTFSSTTLTTAIGFDLTTTGFGSTYSAGRDALALLCTQTGSCPTATAGFPLQVTNQCTQW